MKTQLYVKENKKQIIILLMKSIAVVFMAMLLSCKNNINEVNAIVTRGDTLPERSFDELEIEYTDSTKLKFRLFAQKAETFISKKRPYIEFPKGIKVISYDKNQKEASRITANYAIFWQEENLWEARNNVRSINTDGEVMETEYLVWNMKEEKVHSTENVKITNKDGVLYGKGFEADQNLKNMKMYEVTGTIDVKETEPEKK